MQVVPRLEHGPSTTAHFRRRMKLIRFGEPRSEKPGVLVNDRRLDYPQSLVIGMARSSPPVDSGVRGSTPFAVARVVPRGATLDAVGRTDCSSWENCMHRFKLHDHARESGMEIPKEPILFLKATNTVVGPNDDLLIPRRSKRTNWEIELGVILEKEARYLASPDEVPGVMKLGMKLWVNDQLRQNGNTGAMIFGPAHPDRPRDGRVDI